MASEQVERNLSIDLAVGESVHRSQRESLVAARQAHWQPLLTGLGLLVIFLAFLIAVQFATPHLVGNDGYYHIKLAQVMRIEGLKPDFDWLPLTILNPTSFVDHHFLYHVFLIPFTFGDLRLGAKLASVIFPALSFLAIWWLLYRQEVPYAPLWALGILAASEAFLYRMSMPRAQALSLGFLAVALHWTLVGKYRWLAPLSFFYVWLSNTFPLILLVIGAYILARGLADRYLPWRPLFYTGLGVVSGLVINPYFPDNLTFIVQHIGPKLMDPTSIRVGSEWYPYETSQLISNSGLALLAFLAGVLAMGLHTRRADSRTLAAFFLGVSFGAMTFQSRRFIEYFPPFVMIFAALAWRPLLLRFRGLRSMSGDQPPSGIPNLGLIRRLHHLSGRLIPLAAAVVLAIAMAFNLAAARESVTGSKRHTRYAQAATWLAANTPPGARVFQTDWDDFPRLFFYNTHNSYTLGLDPTYMQLYNPALFDLWVETTKGRVESLSAVIRDSFGASYAFTDLNHKGFLEAAKDDPGMVEVFRDSEAAVFQVIIP